MLTFEVEASDGTDKIGSGTHQRFVVDSTKFMEKASAKAGGAAE